MCVAKGSQVQTAPTNVPAVIMETCAMVMASALLLEAKPSVNVPEGLLEMHVNITVQALPNPMERSVAMDMAHALS